MSHRAGALKESSTQQCSLCLLVGSCHVPATLLLLIGSSWYEQSGNRVRSETLRKAVRWRRGQGGTKGSLLRLAPTRWLDQAIHVHKGTKLPALAFLQSSVILNVVALVTLQSSIS